MLADLPDALLRSLSSAQVRLYAVRAGWTIVNGVKRPVVVLNHPSDDLTQIHLPQSTTDRDYAYLMGDAVCKLAEFEHRQPAELLHDLTMPPADVLRLRIQSRDADSGTLPLAFGLNLIRGGQGLLQAAACSAYQPQAYYRSQTFSPVVTFLNNCRIGQTERGSFVATLIAPVTPELTPTIFDGVDDAITEVDEPFERRVTLTLMRALQSLRGSLDSGRMGDLLRAVPQGVSANLCETLAEMTPGDPQASLQLGMSWSRNRPRVPHVMVRQVSFAQPEFGILREAGRKLKSMESRSINVQGHIIGLQAEPADLVEEYHGNVTIRAVIEGRTARVRFVLKQADYTMACDAHRDRRQVAVTGVLHGDAQARIYELNHPHSFRVMSTPAPDSESSPIG